MQYVIEQVNSWSAAKFGLVIGAAIGVLPGLAVGTSLARVVTILRTWLDGWLVIDLALFGSFSLIEALALEEFLRLLQQLDDQAAILVIGTIVLVVLGSSLLTGATFFLATAVYNVTAALTGGLTIKARPLQVVGAGVSAGTSPLVPVTPVAPAADYWLLHSSTNQRWPVTYGQTSIGSSSANQIIVPDLVATHADIKWQDGRFILYDYSEGQTWVNGRQITGRNMIKPGFEIQLANQAFIFQASN